jgi:hypothetical protein
MKILLLAGAVACCACAAKSPYKDPAYADNELQQLMQLYQEARAKFVAQKQAMIAEEDCVRAAALRAAADRAAALANMSPDPSHDITKVQMELTQAEKSCLEK